MIFTYSLDYKLPSPKPRLPNFLFKASFRRSKIDKNLSQSRSDVGWGCDIETGISHLSPLFDLIIIKHDEDYVFYTSCALERAFVSSSASLCMRKPHHRNWVNKTFDLSLSEKACGIVHEIEKRNSGNRDKDTNRRLSETEKFLWNHFPIKMAFAERQKSHSSCNAVDLNSRETPFTKLTIIAFACAWQKCGSGI